MSLKETVSRNIRRIRKSKDLSQDAVARTAGWETSFVNRLERNPQNLSLTTIEMVASALNVHPAELFADDAMCFDCSASIEEFDRALGMLGALRKHARILTHDDLKKIK